MKQTLTFLSCLCALVLSAQKVEVYNESGFKHDYVISDLAYLEDLRDTSRLNYIATLRINDVHQGILKVAAFQDLIQIRAKSLGANVYYASHYWEDEKSATLEAKLYFGGERFLKQNEAKRDTNGVFVFCQVRLPNDTVSFYVGETRKTFESKKFYRMQAELKQEYTLFAGKSTGAYENVLFKKTKPSRFFILPSLRNQGMNAISVNKGLLGVIQAGVLLSTFYEMKYGTGRLLMAVYK